MPDAKIIFLLKRKRSLRILYDTNDKINEFKFNLIDPCIALKAVQKKSLPIREGISFFKAYSI